MSVPACDRRSRVARSWPRPASPWRSPAGACVTLFPESGGPDRRIREPRRAIQDPCVRLIPEISPCDRSGCSPFGHSTLRRVGPRPGRTRRVSQQPLDFARCLKAALRGTIPRATVVAVMYPQDHPTGRARVRPLAMTVVLALLLVSIGCASSSTAGGAVGRSSTLTLHPAFRRVGVAESGILASSDARTRAHATPNLGMSFRTSAPDGSRM